MKRVHLNAGAALLALAAGGCGSTTSDYNRAAQEQKANRQASAPTAEDVVGRNLGGGSGAPPAHSPSGAPPAAPPAPPPVGQVPSPQPFGHR